MSGLNPLGTALGVLRAAKEQIEARGWRSGFHHDNNSGGYPRFKYPLCAYDAIIAAKGGFQATQKAIEIMRGTVAPNGDWRSVSIIDWNDKHGRTVDQVNVAFDRAIATAAEAS
jgi:hypothetical protein